MSLPGKIRGLQDWEALSENCNLYSFTLPLPESLKTVMSVLELNPINTLVQQFSLSRRQPGRSWTAIWEDVPAYSLPQENHCLCLCGCFRVLQLSEGIRLMWWVWPSAIPSAKASPPFKMTSKCSCWTEAFYSFVSAVDGGVFPGSSLNWTRGQLSWAAVTTASPYFSLYHFGGGGQGWRTGQGTNYEWNKLELWLLE